MQESRETIEGGGLSQQQRANRTLLGIIAAAILCVFVGVIAVVVVIDMRRQSTPKEAILRHPDKAMVAAGLTKEDLEEAEERLKEYAKSYVQGAVRGVMSGDVASQMDQARQDLYPIHELLATGRIVIINNGAKCLILKSSRSVCKIRITEGPKTDKIYWVYKNCLASVD